MRLCQLQLPDVECAAGTSLNRIKKKSHALNARAPVRSPIKSVRDARGPVSRNVIFVGDQVNVTAVLVEGKRKAVKHAGSAKVKAAANGASARAGNVRVPSMSSV